MKDLNRMMIIGRLGSDPVLKKTKNGHDVLNLSVATSRKFKNGEETDEQTQWHRVVVWDKEAEHCAKYLSKGQLVFVEGTLRTRDYESNGQTRTSVEVIADSVSFLSGKRTGTAGAELNHENMTEAATGF